MSDDDLVSIIAHGIADAQGDAYAEYSSEFDGYAKAAVDALKKNLAGLSTNGINVWGNPSDIKTVMRALYSDSIIGDVRTNLAHWRDECGKLHAHRLEMLTALKACVEAMSNDHPGDNNYWKAVELADAAVAKAEGRS